MFLFYHMERFPAPHKVRMSLYSLDVYIGDEEAERAQHVQDLWSINAQDPAPVGRETNLVAVGHFGTTVNEVIDQCLHDLVGSGLARFDLLGQRLIEGRPG